MRSRHNEQMAHIQMLKESLNMARRERVIFSGVFRKLESDIKSRDEEFKSEIIKKLAVEAEYKVLEEDLRKLKKKAKKQLEQFKNEYKQTIQQYEEEVEQKKRQHSINYQNSIDNQSSILQSDQLLVKLVSIKIGAILAY